MPPWGNLDRELTCHMSHGGMLCGVVTCAFRGDPYNGDNRDWQKWNMITCESKGDKIKYLNQGVFSNGGTCHFAKGQTMEFI